MGGDGAPDYRAVAGPVRAPQVLRMAELGRPLDGARGGEDCGPGAGDLVGLGPAHPGN